MDQATNIYYNCASPECTVLQWIHTTTISEDVTFDDLLANEVRTNVRYLLGLQQDPYVKDDSCGGLLDERPETNR